MSIVCQSAITLYIYRAACLSYTGFFDLIRLNIVPTEYARKPNSRKYTCIWEPNLFTLAFHH